MNIVVYLGSSYGNKDCFKEDAYALGTWISESGNCLIYGGSDCGTMKSLADGVIDHSGKIKGVMPSFMIERKRNYELVTDFEVVDSMHTRIKRMIELGDVFVIMPGGLGTLEEFFVTIDQIVLGLKNASIVVYNKDGYYDSLKQQMDMMKQNGFMSDVSNVVQFVETMGELKECL